MVEVLAICCYAINSFERLTREIMREKTGTPLHRLAFAALGTMATFMSKNSYPAHGAPLARSNGVIGAGDGTLNATTKRRVTLRSEEV